jgi:predicted DNA-binding transcriptional regulator AlpA
MRARTVGLDSFIFQQSLVLRRKVWLSQRMAGEGENGNGATQSGVRLLSEREVAERLSISEVTLQNWRATGKKGPAWLRLEGRTIRYRESDIDAWLSAQEVQPSRLVGPSPQPGGVRQAFERYERRTPIESNTAPVGAFESRGRRGETS